MKIKKLFHPVILYHFLFGLFLFLLTLGQLQRIQVTTNIAFYLHDVLILGWCGAAVIFDTQFRKNLLEVIQHFRKRKEFLFIAWIGVGLLAAVLQGSQVFTALLYFARLATYFVFAVLLFNSVHRHILSRASIFLGFLLYGLFILYFGLVQYVLLPDTRWLFFLGWDDHYYRLVSTLFDPGFTGLILVMAFCLLQALRRQNLVQSHYAGLLQALPSTKFQWLKLVFSCLFIVGILLTYSRASYLAFLAAIVMSVCYYAWRKAQRRQFGTLIFYVLFFLICLRFLPHPGGEGVNLARTSTVYARTTNISATLQKMKPVDWVVGRGLFVSVSKPATEFQQPDHAQIQDNWLIFILQGTGVTGLLLFLGMVWVILIKFYQKNVWLAVAFATILIHGMFDASVVYPFVLLFLIGIVVAIE